MTHLPVHTGIVAEGLPRVMGRDLYDGEAVLVGISDTRRDAALLLGATLEDGDDPARLADLMLITARRDGVEAAAVIVSAADAADIHSPAAQVAAAVVLRAESHGITPLDALWVFGGRYASYLCEVPSCCPPEGSPIPTPEEPHP